MTKHVIFTVPGTHESHVWVSTLGDADTAIVNGVECTVPKICFNCHETDKWAAAEVECTAIGARWPKGTASTTGPPMCADPTCPEATATLRLAADALEAQPPKLREQYVAALRLYADEPWRMARTHDPRTHGLNHAALPEGQLLHPGFCAGCDATRGEGRDVR